MGLIKFLIWLITRPIVIVLYIVKLVFWVITSVGHLVTGIVAGLCILGSIIGMIGGDFSIIEGILGIALSIGIYYLPVIGGVIMGIIDTIIGVVDSLSA